MSSSAGGFDPRFYERIASMTNPGTLSAHLYLWHTERTVTIIEQYPKSKIHVIMIPRVGAAPRVPANLTNIHHWLSSKEVPRSQAQALLLDMKKDAEILINKLKEEMEYSFSYSSNFWMGFRVTSSYNYLHMHVMSDDLTGEYMKSPKNFFSFHPHFGYFYPLCKVLSWFDILEESFQFNLREMQRKVRRSDPYSDLTYDCYHNDGWECNVRAPNFPAMRAHLEEHAEDTKAAFIRKKEDRERLQRIVAARQARLAAREREDRERNDGQSEPQHGQGVS